MAIPARLVITRGNDQQITVDGLRNKVTLAYLNVATVSAKLIDENGADVTGGGPWTLNYVASSNGKYQGDIPDTFNVTPGSLYRLHITGTEGGVKVDYKIPTTVKDRDS